MKNTVVISLSRRILEKMDRYRPIQDCDQYKSFLVGKFALQKDEVPIGVYVNQPGHYVENIIITNLGLYLFVDGEPEYIDYSQIKSIETPGVKDTEQLVIHLATEGVVELHIQGKRDRFYDVFEFLRFLDRVLTALQITT